jgi:hypothetical protein
MHTTTPHNIRVTMTMVCRYWYYQIVSLLFARLAAAAAPVTAAEDNTAFCNCQYTIPADWEPRCRVFGHVATHNDHTAGDDHHHQQLVAFERANQSCIDQLSLAEADGGSLTYSNEEMWAMCPFANGTNTNVQLAMNELQYGGDKSTAVRTIQSLLPGFFQPSSTAIGIGLLELQNSIYDARTSPVDCQAAPRNCWSTIREFVTVNETLRSLVCQQFHIDHQLDNAEQQWRARLQLCAGAAVPLTDSAACEPLMTRIADLKRSFAAGTSVDCNSIFIRPNATLLQDVAVCDFENPILLPSKKSEASRPLLLRLTTLPFIILISVVWSTLT